ncbi:hypothetical protein [Clostridium sp. CF012]|nr:hypothetical protein [Clostridium sp. CF012]
MYKEINLAVHERGYFQAGNELPVLKETLALNNKSLDLWMR